MVRLSWMCGLTIAAVLMLTVLARADQPATKPSPSPAAPTKAAATTSPSQAAQLTTAELQLRANEAMAKQDYTTALPLLETVAKALTDSPDDLGPVMEQIRVCKRNLKPGAVAHKDVPVPGAEHRTPHPAPTPGQVVTLDIKQLGNFDYDAEKGGNIPDDVKGLDGCHIRTHGFMIPLDQAESISEFALVPSLFACCFGQPPQIQHTIVVHCPKGKAMSYFPNELLVDGKLHVREQREGGFVVSIFDIDATSIRPAAQ